LGSTFLDCLCFFSFTLGLRGVDAFFFRHGGVVLCCGIQSMFKKLRRSWKFCQLLHGLAHRQPLPLKLLQQSFGGKIQIISDLKNNFDDSASLWYFDCSAPYFVSLILLTFKRSGFKTSSNGEGSAHFPNSPKQF
jgi:hypothetical protein